MADQDQMSDQDPPEPRLGIPSFKNPDTLLRRAWIDRALAGVRNHLRSGEPPSPGDMEPSPVAEPDPQGSAGPVKGPARLYLVPGSKGR